MNVSMHVLYKHLFKPNFCLSTLHSIWNTSSSSFVKVYKSRVVNISKPVALWWSLSLLAFLLFFDADCNEEWDIWAAGQNLFCVCVKPTCVCYVLLWLVFFLCCIVAVMAASAGCYLCILTLTCIHKILSISLLNWYIYPTQLYLGSYMHSPFTWKWGSDLF